MAMTGLALLPLGQLGRLPAEVRATIWMYLLPEYDPRRPSTYRHNSKVWHNYLPPGSSFSKASSRLAILFAHPVLYDEIYPKLGQQGILYISLQHDKYGWFFKDQSNSTKPDFYQPFSERFHSVRISIYAVGGRNDPGRLIELRQRAMHLACGLASHQSLFSNCPEPYDLPYHQRYQEILNSSEQNGGWHRKFNERPTSIEFEFVNDQQSSWFNEHTSRIVRKTVDVPDLETIMSVFSFVNNYPVTSIKFVFYYYAEESESIQQLAQSVVNGMRTPTFLLFRQNDSNRPLIQQQTTRTFKLDEALDEMPGETAAHLRRERFKNWLTYDIAMRNLRTMVSTVGGDSEQFIRPLYMRNEIRKALSPGHDCLIEPPNHTNGWKAVMTDPWIEKYPHGVPTLKSTVSLEQLCSWVVKADEANGPLRALDSYTDLFFSTLYWR